MPGREGLAACASGTSARPASRTDATARRGGGLLLSLHPIAPMTKQSAHTTPAIFVMDTPHSHPAETFPAVAESIMRITTVVLAMPFVTG